MGQTWGPAVKKYSKEITSIRDTGKASEFSYRTPFQNLIDHYARAKGLSLKTIQEQKRERFGAPDFAVLAHDSIPHGYIETKDIDVNLSDILTGRLRADKERLDKYLEAVPNLVLTNYEDFCLFRDGKKIATASLSQPQRLEELLETFFLYEYPPATRPKELAVHLAKRCKVLKEVVLETLKLEEGAKAEKVLSPY
ncbi:MAG: hypothetical protein Q6354_03070, partial [Candidatus Brocadiales bacterium]|nr:hypothetical protein [Candidatus Brocadiales bacterium]